MADDEGFSDIEGEKLFDHNSLMQKSKQLGLLPLDDSNVPQGSFSLHYPCTVTRVLVKDNSQVKRMQPLFVVNAQPPPPPLLLSEIQKLLIKEKLVEETGVLKQEEYNDRMNNLDHLRPPNSFDFINFGKKVDWFSNIQDEISILANHSPETIFVRPHASRKDVLSALIVGQEGTPYHDCLFLFDVFIPDSYPDLPPVVRYRSGPPPGINPQLKKNGEVRMFILNTDGTRQSLWVPGTSILQLLLMIQVLVLNSRPLFNAPLYTNSRRKVVGERNALLYNENTIITSLKTMVYLMNKPPTIFKDVVLLHFRKRVHAILTSCTSYMEDAVEGSLVTGDSHRCSNKFKHDLASCYKHLIKAFNKIGAKEAQDFLSDLLPLTGRETSPAVDENMNDTAKRKRKADDEDIKVYQRRTKKSKVVDFNDEGMDVAEKRKWKEVTICAPSNLIISKILVIEGMEVKQFQPMYIRGRGRPIIKKPTPKPALRHTSVQKILHVNRKSRLGIFSMEDGLVDEDGMVADVEYGPMTKLDMEDVRNRYAQFKKFDIVEDHSDHFFAAESCEMNQPSEKWVNKIHEEWTVLEEQLPDTIYVRVYQSRPDLLRAVIVGREGTPYCDGLFFFDVCFPSNYPNSPPLVHYHSCGLGINPSMHKSGEVVLSSLPIANGGHEPLWVAGTWTMLHLLEAIQYRLLNKEPLFNDVTYAVTRGSDFGEQSSLLYNDNVLVKSLRTMSYIMNKPPKEFEDFVVGHFQSRIHDIMIASTKKTTSITLKNDLSTCSKLLKVAFKKIGVKGIQEM